MTPGEVSKASLRRSLLQARRNLPVDVWQTRSQQICDRLASLPIVQSSRTILAYFSIRQEPDLTSLFTSLPTTSHQWGFPRCEGDRLIWHHWNLGEPLIKGAFGILEPSPEAIAVIPENVDLILVPAVACDWRGYRLGYGGGFYDRLLSQPDWCAKDTIGIVFEDAFLPELPIDEWDCPLSGVCTNAQFRAFRSS